MGDERSCRIHQFCEDVVPAELGYIKNRRQRVRDERQRGAAPSVRAAAVAEGRDGLVGLALSGGGIRSATTNLGILQTLSRLGVLPMVDYLSTVSGGGYIGSCLSSLLSLNHQRLGRLDADHAPLFSTERASFPLSDQRATSSCEASFSGKDDGNDVAPPLNGQTQVSHLRTHGDFLIARAGVFRRETLRAIGNLVTGTSYSVTVVLLALLLAAAVTMASAEWLVGPTSLDGHLAGSWTERGNAATASRDAPSLGDEVAQLWSAVSNDIGALWAGGATYLVPLALAFGVGIIVAAATFFLMRWRAGLMPHGVDEPTDDEPERRLITVAGAALLLATVAFSVVLPGQRYSPGIAWLFIPTVVMVGARLASVAIALRLPDSRLLAGRTGGGWSRSGRSLWGAYQGITSYGLVAALTAAVVPLLAYTVARYGLYEAGSALFAGLASWWLGRRQGGGGPSRIPAVLTKPLLGAAVFTFVLLTVLAWSSLLVMLGRWVPYPHSVWLSPLAVDILAAVGVGVVLLGLGVAINYNKIGLHYFYRDRLVETYLRTEGRRPDGTAVTLRDTGRLKLKDLHGTANETPTTTAPYHLISAAINLSGSRDLTRKDRQSGYFLFSRFFCGSDTTGYRQTDQYRDGETRLARAVTISGAAASSAMGYHTYFAQAFATTFFNLRLGYWMENPRYETCLGGTEGDIFWHRYMVKEIVSDTTSEDRLVNLSDGGHTGDNLGIYPLLKRRCRVIIACDAEADPTVSFESLTEALRHAYIDLGVQVDINLRMLRPDPETGLSRGHCAIGRIRYPAIPGPALTQTQSTGWLIVIKNTLSGDEAAPVTNYKGAHPDFPHETTADQFFDDAQFESYRSLGVHLAQRTFEDWENPGTSTKSLQELERSHLPFSAGDSAEFQEMTKDYMAIERMFVERADLAELAGEINPLPGPGRSVRARTGPTSAERSMYALMIQLMEKVFFAVEFGDYPNAPDNAGWMNMFRRWSCSPTLDQHFGTLAQNYTKEFVDFYEDYVRGYIASIKEAPVPHPWDDTLLTPTRRQVTGVPLDRGN